MRLTGQVWHHSARPVRQQLPAAATSRTRSSNCLTGEQDRVRASVVHPGHISGPGWMPIGPAGNLDPGVIDSLRADGSVLLPDRGGETIHHVHAEDVARLHQACLEKPEVAAGQSFNSVCTRAFTLP